VSEKVFTGQFSLGLGKSLTTFSVIPIGVLANEHVADNPIRQFFRMVGERGTDFRIPLFRFQNRLFLCRFFDRGVIDRGL
jgi:hypothetical protein